MSALGHVIRPATGTPDEVGFVLDPWLKELRHAPASRYSDDVYYYPDQKQVVIALLQRSHVLFAVAEDDPSHKYGYIVYEPAHSVVHWIYTLSCYRNLGVAASMMAAAFPERPPGHVIYATHAGRMWEELEPRLERHAARHLKQRGGTFPMGVMKRRAIFYRPQLLLLREMMRTV